MHIVMLSQLFDTHGAQSLERSLQARGHTLQLVRPLDCTVHLDRRGSGVIYQGRPIERADIALLRCVAHTRYGMTVVRSMEANVAAQLELTGTLCINSPAAKLRAHDKFLSLQILHRAGLPVPPSVLTWDPVVLEQLIEERLGTPVVLKTGQGSLGVGVMRAESAGAALSIHDTMRSMDRVVLAQQFIAEAQHQDIRAMVVGGRVVGAFRRMARAGEFRSNIHRGGSAEVIELPADYRRVAVAAARALDLALAGVDILETADGPLVLEVNPSPGWKQIELLSDLDIAGQIVGYLEARLAGRQ